MWGAVGEHRGNLVNVVPIAATRFRQNLPKLRASRGLVALRTHSAYVVIYVDSWPHSSALRRQRRPCFNRHCVTWYLRIRRPIVQVALLEQAAAAFAFASGMAALHTVDPPTGAGHAAEPRHTLAAPLGPASPSIDHSFLAAGAPHSELLHVHLCVRWARHSGPTSGYVFCEGLDQGGRKTRPKSEWGRPNFGQNRRTR